jgi:hypothetical protein
MAMSIGVTRLQLRSILVHRLVSEFSFVIFASMSVSFACYIAVGGLSNMSWLAISLSLSGICLLVGILRKICMYYKSRNQASRHGSRVFPLQGLSVNTSNLNEGGDSATPIDPESSPTSSSSPSKYNYYARTNSSSVTANGTPVKCTPTKPTNAASYAERALSFVAANNYQSAMVDAKHAIRLDAHCVPVRNKRTSSKTSFC